MVKTEDFGPQWPFRASQKGGRKDTRSICIIHWISVESNVVRLFSRLFLVISTVNCHANNNTGNLKNQSINPPRPRSSYVQYWSPIFTPNATLEDTMLEWTTLAHRVQSLDCPLTLKTPHWPQPPNSILRNIGKWVAQSLIRSSPLRESLSFVFVCFPIVDLGHIIWNFCKESCVGCSRVVPGNGRKQEKMGDSGEKKTS